MESLHLCAGPLCLLRVELCQLSKSQCFCEQCVRQQAELHTHQRWNYKRCLQGSLGNVCLLLDFAEWWQIKGKSWINVLSNITNADASKHGMRAQWMVWRKSCESCRSQHSWALKGDFICMCWNPACNTVVKTTKHRNMSRKRLGDSTPSIAACGQTLEGGVDLLDLPFLCSYIVLYLKSVIRLLLSVFFSSFVRVYLFICLLIKPSASRILCTVVNGEYKQRRRNKKQSLIEGWTRHQPLYHCTWIWAWICENVLT